MFKKEPEDGLLRMLYKAVRGDRAEPGSDGQAKTAAADGASAANDIATKASDASAAGSPAEKTGGASVDGALAAKVGEMLIQNVADSLQVGAEEAALLLLGQAPDGVKGISARAANELFRLKKENALEGEPEDYVNDPVFLALLREMPPAAALRVYASEKREGSAKRDLEAAKEAGARDLMEKLLARQALPAQLRSNALAAPETDFSSMSSEQFHALKTRLSRNARQNRDTK